MVDQGSEFNFFQSVHVRINISIDICISKFLNLASRYITEFDSNETNQAGAGDAITLRSRNKLKALYLHY